MPVSAVLILVGVLSISALPPFSGFISEWLTLQSLLLGFKMDTTFPMIVLSISAAFLALTGALAAFCFLKSFGIGFLALPRSEHAEHAREVNLPMLAGMGILALLSILLVYCHFISCQSWEKSQRHLLEMQDRSHLALSGQLQFLPRQFRYQHPLFCSY